MPEYEEKLVSYDIDEDSTGAKKNNYSGYSNNYDLDNDDLDDNSDDIR